MPVDASFVLIRHAESSWNARGRWQGQGDPPLSPRGRAQARALAGSLGGERVDRLVASDLVRARETAAAVARVWGRPVFIDARLRELDVGRWSGLTRAEIFAREPEALARFDAGDPGAPAGGGESRAQLADRASAVARELARAHPGRRIALVTHLGVIRALLPGTELANAGWCRAQARELGRVARPEAAA